MGRKKINIDWDRVGKLLQAQCSAIGIASLLGIHERSLYGRCEKDLNIQFTDFATQKRSEGIELLRAKQFEIAMKGNIVMNIWLGKQYLGQSEKTDHTTKGESIKPVEISVNSSNVATDLKKFIENAGKLN